MILSDPHSFLKFEDNDVVIPTVVIEEIDGKKRLLDDIGRNAREAARTLDRLRQQNPLNLGVSTEGGGTLRVEMNHQLNRNMQKVFPELNNDNRILSVAYTIWKEEETSEKPVILVSNDAIMRIKADALGLRTEDYRNDRVTAPDRLYRGFREVSVAPGIIDRFYRDRQLDPELLNMDVYPNQFFILKDEAGSSQSAVARCKAGRLVPLHFGVEPIWGITGRNIQQRMALELLMDDRISLVTINGRAGTGKTLLALAAALTKVVDDHHYRKLLVARPVVPMGRDIGYLPGEKDDKLRPWMQPIYDNLEFLFSADEKNPLENMMMGMKNIELEALTYIRGRSIPRQFIIVDEAQNLTRHEAKTIISRAGEGSKIVLVGDPEQIDNPYIDSTSNGLSCAAELFKEQELAGHITLVKGERSQLAEMAAELM